MAHKTGPVALVFARQSVPVVRRDGGPENRSARGAYILADAVVGVRRVTLLATGSEVSLALEARQRLEAEGIGTAVVSMPSWEIFANQPESYRAEVIGRGTLRVGIEAAVRFGWDRWIGEDGIFIGMSRFGASASADVLYRHFGITADHVVAAVKDGITTLASP
jgi:transketolase